MTGMMMMTPQVLLCCLPILALMLFPLAWWIYGCVLFWLQVAVTLDDSNLHTALYHYRYTTHIVMMNIAHSSILY